MSSADPPLNGITVIGSGSATAAVDRVSIALAVEVVRAEPGDAFADSAATATRLLAILADAGVDSRSVRTSDLTLGPRTEYTNGRQQVLGYQAGQRLTVTLDGLHGIRAGRGVQLLAQHLVMGVVVAQIIGRHDTEQLEQMGRELDLLGQLTEPIVQQAGQFVAPVDQDAALPGQVVQPDVTEPDPIRVARLIESKVGGLHNGLTNTLLLARREDLAASPWLPHIFDEVAASARAACRVSRCVRACRRSCARWSPCR